MPKINPTQILPRTSRIKDPSTREYAKRLNFFLDELIRKIALADDITQVQQVEIIVGTGTGGAASNWLVKEATATDVTNGDAVAEGNLLVWHRTGKARHEFEAAD